MDQASKEIERYDFKDGLPIEFEIIAFADMYRTGKPKMTVPHRTNFYHILWFKNKDSSHLVDFYPIHMTSESLLFLGKNNVHQFNNTDSHQDGLAILFTDDFFCKTEEQTKLLHSTYLFNNLITATQVQLSQEKQRFTDIIMAMQHELSHPADIFQADILRNLLHNFLLLSERQRRTQQLETWRPSADLDQVMLFKELLERNYTTQKQVGSYAEKMCLTEKRLNQATSKTLGKSPKQLINERVMLEAKRLLVYTDGTVKEIGFKLGFDEPTNFIKYFKKQCGFRPLAFRETFTTPKNTM